MPTLTGTLAAPTDLIYFTFTVDTPGDVVFETMTAGDGLGTEIDTEIFIFTDAGNGVPGIFLGTNDDIALGTDQDSMITLAGLAAGDYVIVVGQWNMDEADARSGVGGSTSTDTGSFDLEVTALTGSISGFTQSVNPMEHPVITSADLIGDVTENDGNVYAETGDIEFTDEIGDVHSVNTANGTTDAPGGSFIGVLSAGLSNSATGDGAGTVTWSFDITDAGQLAIVESLADGEVITQTYDITITDTDGGTVTQTVTMTINGINDAPEITVGGSDSDSAMETETNADIEASGTLSVEDIDTTDEVFASLDSVAVNVASTGTDGGISNAALLAMMTVTPIPAAVIDGTGTTGTINWDFDSAGTAFDYLADGETLVLDYVISATDDSGTATDSDSQTVTITITGTNDAAIVTGTAGGAAVEDAMAPPIVNDLDHTDVDGTDDLWTAATGVVGTYGTLDITAAGVWTYTLNGADPDTDALNAGQMVQDIIQVTTADGTTQDITIDITGANDAAAIAGDINNSGDAVIEAGVDGAFAPIGDSTATGTLTHTDVDSGDADNLFTAVTGLAGTYGSLDMDSAGNWTFTLDDASTAVQELDDGDMVQDTFNVTSSDGTVQVITIDITGSNDAADVGGPFSGPLLEAGVDGAGAPVGFNTGTIDFDFTDVDDDDADDAWTPVVSASSSYGTYSISATGVFSYSIDEANTDVDALNVGDTLMETIVVTTTDGTEKEVIITIAGSNDAPTITAEAFTVNDTSAPDAFTNVTGTLDGADVDHIATDLFYGIVGVTPDLAGTSMIMLSDGGVDYGVLTVMADGSYTFDPIEAAIDALEDSDTIVITQDFLVNDGASPDVINTLTITIEGENDVPVSSIVGYTGAVTEDSGPATHMVTDTITYTDAEPGQTHSVTISPDAMDPNVGDYVGTLSGGQILQTSGGASGTPGEIQWTFSVDNTDIQFLAEGEMVTQNYVVTIEDSDGGTFSDTIEITLTGTNDAPTITVDGGAGDSDAETITETDAGLTESGTLSVEDVDVIDTVGVAITDVSAVGATNGITLAALQAMMTADIGDIIDNTSTTGTANWSFDSGSEAFNYLALGESLELTYEVTVTDSENVEATTNVVITIQGSNDAPVISSDGGGATASVNVDENTTAVTTVTFDDLDLTDTHTFGLTGADAGLFSIDASGNLSFTAAPDFETDNSEGGGNAYEVIVTVTDDNGLGFLSDSQAITVNVQDVNEAPTAISLNTIQDNIDENTDTSAGVHVADIVVTDDALGTNTLSLVGADAASFEIRNGDELFYIGGDPDFETQDQYDVAVQVDDTGVGATPDATSATFEFDINDINEAPVITSDGGGATASVNVDENTTAVTTVTFDDEDTLDSHTYSLTGIDSGLFSIDTSGNITFDAAPDFEMDNSEAGGNAYAITVNVTDNGTGMLADSQDITVNVQDVNEAPTAVTLTTVLDNIDENTDTSAGIVVATIAVTDDALGTNDLTVVGPDAADFSIIGNQLVYTGADPNFEVQDEYNVAVQVDDTAVGATPDATSATFTLDINDINDAPVAGPDVGAVNEGSLVTINVLAGAGPNGLDTDEDGDGIFVDGIQDVDGPDSAAVTALTPGTIITDLGAEVTVQENGLLTYNATNATAAFNALGVGDTTVDTFEYTINDGNGGTDTGTVEITITGVNDSVIAVADTITANENDVDDGMNALDIAGDILDNDIDVDVGDVATVVAANSGVGAIASPTPSGFQIELSDNVIVNLNTDGTYTVDIPDALIAGQTVTGTFSYITQDEGGATSSASVTVNVTGINDIAVISGTSAGTAIEDTSDTSGTLTVVDLDTGEAEFAPSSQMGSYGSFAIDAAGAWTYTLDNGNTTVDALNVGDSLIEMFTVFSEDGTDSEVVTITINGTNDGAVIGGDLSGGVDEDGLNAPASTSGTATAADVDNADNSFDAVAAGTSTYGEYTIASNGDWTYTLDDNNPTVDALNDSFSLSDSFTITSEDGTTETVNISITGTNDAAIIAGVDTGSADENSGVAAEGTLTSMDVDNPDNSFTAVNVPTASDMGYGTFTIDASGNWAFTIDDSNPTVDALNVGDDLTDTFDITAEDGAIHTVTVTIEGANDAAVIAGDLAGSVDEDGADAPASTSGTATATDVDNADDSFVANPTGTSTYGTFTVASNGAWTYTLDDANATVEALNDGDPLSDSFSIESEDGTFETVNISITGTNDAAIVGGDTTGSADEDSGVDATGTLTATDVDNTDNSFTAVVAPTASDSGYGTYTVDSAGNWAFSIDESNATVDALNVGDDLTDTFDVVSEDGTVQTVTVTIDGANDAAVISGTTSGFASETGDLTPGSSASGSLSATDVDNLDDAFTAVGVPAASGSGYGTFTIDAAGNWEYFVDDNNATVQALNDTDSLNDTFTVTSVDGTEQLISVTIFGANDDAAIGGDTSGSTDEDSGVSAIGTLTSMDIDNPDNAFVAELAPNTSDGMFGEYTVDASGNWTYTVDDNNAVVDALDDGDVLNDSFTVESVDGTQQSVSITINGADDEAVIVADETGAVDEGDVGDVVTTTGSIAVSDVDSGDNPSFANAVAAGVYGAIAVNAAGDTWTYTLDQTTVQDLDLGATATDTVTVTDDEGNSVDIEVTITGTNDGPVANVDTDLVPEDGGELTGSVATNDSDLDANAVLSYTLDAPIDGLTLNGDGSYSFDPTDAAYQYLAAGDSVDVVANYTVTDEHEASDGSTLTITVLGTNDVPIAVEDTGAAVEDGVIVSGTVADNDSDVDDNAVLSYALDAPVTGLTLNLDGSYMYDPTQDASFQSLAVGQSVDVVASYTVSDEFGAMSSSTLTITVAGSNDVATISGVSTGDVVEDNVFTTSGLLSVADIDDGDTELQAIAAGTSGDNGYGTFEVSSDGNWTFTLDNDSAAVQAIALGAQVDETITVLSADGSASQVITVTITGGLNTIVGTSGPDTLIGQDDEDEIYGLDSNDVLIGGDGADIIDGGAGNDWAYFRDSDAAVSINLQTGAASGGDAAGDTISNIERLQGSNFDDTLIGDDANNNTLFGRAGEDALFGRGGNDALDGGEGADALNGGGGSDWVYYTRSDEGVTVNLETGMGTGGEAEGDTYIAIERVLGSDFDDVLIGNGSVNTLRGQGGDDILDGGAGTDTLDGGAGADMITGGGGRDVVTYANSDAGVTINLTTNVNTGGEAEGDTIFDINRVFGSDHDDDITGNGSGNDLRGGEGDDAINGEAGNDIIRGEEGADAIDGGAGTDWVYLSTSDAGVTVDLELGIGLGGDAEGDTYVNVEKVLGSNFDDTLIGDAGANQLRGRDGDDVLDGGAGNDVLSGNAGVDTFVFNAGDTGTDTVTDFAAGETVQLLDFGFADAAAAASSFSQSGTSVVFSYGGVTIKFLGATLSDVLAAVDVGNPAAELAFSSKGTVSEVLDTFSTDFGETSSLQQDLIAEFMSGATIDSPIVFSNDAGVLEIITDDDVDFDWGSFDFI